jgi:hypothetical protein
MITFFRKIRQKLLTENKFSKYLVYAIGEIILVVVGILIALSINNWNDKQKHISQERILLKNVLENIKTDSISIDSVISTTDRILEIHKNLIQLSKHEISENEVGNIDLIRASQPNQVIIKKNNPNLPNQLLDQELKKVILDHYLKIEWFEKMRTDNNEIIEQYIRPILAEKELLNSDFQLSDTGGFNNLINRHKFFEAFKEEDMEQYLIESRIKLYIMKSFAQQMAQKNNETKVAIQEYIYK